MYCLVTFLAIASAAASAQNTVNANTHTIQFAGTPDVTSLITGAKGGIVLAVHDALNIPVKFIGIGEKATDLESFDANVFAEEVLEG